MEEAQSKQAAAGQSNQLQALQQLYAPYLPLIEQARQRIRPQMERDELGTLAVWYKTVGEIAMLAQDYGAGEKLLNEALRLFKQVKDFDCASLIEGCEMLVNAFARRADPEDASATPVNVA